MLDEATIRRLAQEQAQRAARLDACPLIVEAEDLPRIEEHITHVPNFGDYRPKGWELVETYFVDKSGFGANDEPALTFERFCEKVREAGAGFGWAIIEEGEFQCHIGRFKPVRVEKKRATAGVFKQAA